MVQGASTTYTVTTALLSGSAETVALSVTAGLPAGATASFNPPSVSAGGSSTLTIDTADSCGPTTLTIEGVAPSATHSTTVDLTVSGPVSCPAAVRVTGGSLSWYLRDSNSSAPGTVTAFSYGAATDTPVFGDWDGDGTKTAGVVRVTGGSLTWYLRNSNSAGAPDLVFSFGASTDRPLVGDWDGNGTDTPGLLRANWWLLRNSNSAGAVDVDFFWGIATDVPLVGDWDGNGTDTPGWLRCLGASCTAGHGNWWILRNSNSDGPPSLDFFWGRTYEESNWAVGDWDGDGDDNPGILRGEWWLLRAANSDGPTTSDFFFGFPTDTFRVWAQ